MVHVTTQLAIAISVAMSKRKASLLPNLEELAAARKKKKSCVKEVRTFCTEIRNAELPLCFGGNTSPNLDENDCVTWMIAKYGFRQCLSVLTLQQQLPGSLTRQQKLKYITDLSGTDPECVKEIVEFADVACPSAFRHAVESCSEIPMVLAPPVSECYICEKRLVAYHTCSVKYFSTAGVKVVDKVTLRCLECDLFYNFAQYGNKTEVSYCIESGSCFLSVKLCCTNYTTLTSVFI